MQLTGVSILVDSRVTCSSPKSVVVKLINAAHTATSYHPGEVFACVISIGLQTLAERVNPQCRLRAERSSAFVNSKRNAENTRCPSTLLSLNPLRRFIWSAGVRFSQRSVDHPNCRA